MSKIAKSNSLNNRRINKLQISVIVISLAVMISVWGSFLYRGTFNVTFVNVGQGDGAVIQTPGGRHILVDAGPAKRDNIEESLMLEYLFNNGISKADIVVLSHYHDDHYGGLVGILNTLQTELVLLPEPLDDYEYDVACFLMDNLSESTHVAYMEMGESVQLGENITIEALYRKPNKDENERTLVATVRYFNTGILFTGDIAIETESDLLATVPPDKLRADILKVAHHGSKYSSSSAFYDAIDPSFAVISVGKNNYGHPTQDALDRVSTTAEIFRTDEVGSARFIISPDGIEKTPNQADSWLQSIVR